MTSRDRSVSENARIYSRNNSRYEDREWSLVRSSNEARWYDFIGFHPTSFPALYP